MAQQLGAEKSQRIVSMVVLIVCGVDENGHRDIIAVESMAEESGSSYGVLFQNLDGLVVCPRPGLSFQMHTPDWFRQFVNPFPTPHGSRCKVHFMRNILAYVPQKEYEILNRIREARRRSGVSTLKIASALGICRDTVYRWERGETLLSSSVLLNLGHIFGVTCAIGWYVVAITDKTVDGVDIRNS